MHLLRINCKLLGMLIIRKYSIFYIIVALYLLLSTAVLAQEEQGSDLKTLIHPEKPFENELKLTHTGTVTNVIDPLRIEIDHKKIVQLVNIDIPDYDIYEPGPLSVSVKKALEGMLSGKKVKLYQRKDTKKFGYKTRMDHLLGHIVRAQDGLWIQGSLLSEGYARIRPSQYNIEAANEMKTLQTFAQEKQIGLWGMADIPQYHILGADNADVGLHQWSAVEGIITKVATVNNVLYLNFGSDWRKDFTIMIENDVRRKFKESSINPISLTGHEIRVYGWLEEYNGPVIKLLDPIWLDVLDSQNLQD